MNTDRVLVSTISIDKPGQIKLFQVKLPRETEIVRGIETNLKWISGNFPNPPAPPIEWILPFSINRNLLLGEVKLQGCGKANIFYTSDVSINLTGDFGDFSSRHWKPQAHSHQSVNYEEDVRVMGGETLLQGIFKNKLGDLGAPYSYRVNVYVWIVSKTSNESKTKENKK